MFHVSEGTRGSRVANKGSNLSGLSLMDFRSSAKSSAKVSVAEDSLRITGEYPLSSTSNSSSKACPSTRHNNFIIPLAARVIS